MTRSLFVLPLALFFCSILAVAEEQGQHSGANQKTVKATFLVTGLHCASCTDTIEKSLKMANGIRSISVDWKTKKARVEFNEAILPAQKVAQLVANTPHMMGPDM